MNRSTSYLAVLGLLLLSSGCVRSTRTSHQVAAPPGVNATIKRQVLNAVDAGDGDARVRLLQKEMIEHPDRLAPRLDLADQYASLGYPELAVEHLRIAEIRFTANADVVRRLVANLRKMDLAAEAIATIERYEARVDQPDASLSSLRGILLDDRGDHTRAEAAHRLAVKLDPASDTYRNNLGYNLQLQRRPAEAVGEYREALRLKPRSEVARNNLAFALAESGAQTPEVLAHWTSLRGPAAAHNNLGVVLMGQQRYPEARREFEQALGHDSAYAPAWRNLELLSEFDGGPVALRRPDAKTASAWARFRRGLKSAFVGESQVLKPIGPETGSRPRAAR